MNAALILLAVIIGVLLFWYETLRAREHAIRQCKKICESSGLQLLDQTVALTSLAPARNNRGRLCLQRCYQFDVSETGTDRLQGRMILTGRRIEVVYLDGADGTTILYGERRSRLH